MAYFTNSQGYLFLCSDIPFEKTGFSRLYKKTGIAFIVSIKAIPLKVFGRWGAGKITFFQKGVFPAKPFCNSPVFISADDYFAERIAACAAARRAMGTRNGLQET